MFRRAAITIACAGLALAAVGCGSDDDSNATVQDQLTSAVADKLEAVGGVDADEDCVSEAAAELSDADAQTLLDNLDVDPATLNEAQQAFLDKTGACVTIG